MGEHPVAVRQGRVLATSFHPEVSGDDRLHALFLDMVRERSVRRPGGSSTTYGSSVGLLPR